MKWWDGAVWADPTDRAGGMKRGMTILAAGVVAGLAIDFQ